MTDADDHRIIQTPPYFQASNVWNRAGTQAQGQQTLEAPRQRPNSHWQWGWSWNWLANATQQPVAYPSVVYGHKPWGGPAVQPPPCLPRPLTDISVLGVDYEIALQASGRHNLSFDLWLTDRANADAAGIRLEWMIWLAHQGDIQPLGQPLLSCADWVLWQGQAAHGPVASFVMQRAPRRGRLDLMPLLAVLQRYGLAQPEHYLSDIELGTEIWDGQGQCSLRRFEPRIA